MKFFLSSSALLAAITTTACGNGGVASPAAAANESPSTETATSTATATATFIAPLPAPDPSTSHNASLQIPVPPDFGQALVPGTTLPDLEAQAANASFAVHEQAALVAAAEEELLRVQVEATRPRKPDPSTGTATSTSTYSQPTPRIPTPADLGEIDAAGFDLEAARATLALTIATQVGIVRTAYFDLLKKRKNVAALQSTQQFLAALRANISILVNGTEAPPSWLDLINAAGFTNDRDGALAEANLAASSVSLAQAVGAMPARLPSSIADMPPIDLATIGTIDLRAAEAAAVGSSLRIQALIHRRNACLARIRAEQWLLAISPANYPELERVHKIAAEQARADALTAQIAGTESKIRERMIEIELQLNATIQAGAALQQAAVLLESSFVSSRVQVESGDIPFLDLLEIGLRLITTRLDLIRNAYSYLELQAEIDRLAKGGF